MVLYRWNDLLVGAPFYFLRQQEVGGAVYIYLNTGGRFDSRPSLVLKGPDRSAFGMALCAAGDLDQDGFQGKKQNMQRAQKMNNLFLFSYFSVLSFVIL